MGVRDRPGPNFCLPAVTPQTQVQVEAVEQRSSACLKCCAKIPLAGSGAKLWSLSGSLCSFRWDCKTRQLDLDKTALSLSL